jgi:succinyl-CoA synthetase beta subunit
MNIHEYQAKQLLASFDVNVPQGIAVFKAEEAREAAKTLGGSVWAVKAQIHAGGRGKAGGVRICKSLAEVGAAAHLFSLRVVRSDIEIHGNAVLTFISWQKARLGEPVHGGLGVEGQLRDEGIERDPLLAYLDLRHRIEFGLKWL